MINPNNYIKIVGTVLEINQFIGDATIKLNDGTLIDVDIGRSNKYGVHIGDRVKAEVNFRIMSDMYYGPVIKNFDQGK